MNCMELMAPKKKTVGTWHRWWHDNHDIIMIWADNRNGHCGILLVLSISGYLGRMLCVVNCDVFALTLQTTKESHQTTSAEWQALCCNKPKKACRVSDLRLQWLWYCEGLESFRSKMKPDKGLILNLFETNGKNDILNILIPSWSLLEPLGASWSPKSATWFCRSRHPDHQGMDSQPAECEDWICHRGPSHRPKSAGCTGMYRDVLGSMQITKAFWSFYKVFRIIQVWLFIRECGRLCLATAGVLGRVASTVNLWHRFQGGRFYLAQKVANKTCWLPKG